MYQGQTVFSQVMDLRIPPHCDHPFRCKLSTDSAALSPPIPEHCDHPFRWIVTTSDRVNRRWINLTFFDRPAQIHFGEDLWQRTDYPCESSRKC
jgi:hypothetical protein